MSEHQNRSVPLLDKPKCPYCGYESAYLSRTCNEGTHECWKCKREYRIIETTFVQYLCLPIDKAVER